MAVKIKCFTSLRMFFALVVLVSHCGFIKSTEQGTLFFNRWLDNGGYGVQFFIVLSGFCVYIGYGSKFKNNLTIEEYYTFIKKRWIRLFPLYEITMLIAAIAQIMGGYTKPLVWKTIAQFIKATFMLQVFSLDDWGILNSAAWYCSCIFILYLITPFIIIAVNKCNKKRMAMVLAIVMLTPLLEKKFYMYLENISVISVSEFTQLMYTFPVHRLPAYIEGIILCKFAKKYYNLNRNSLAIFNTTTEAGIVLANILYMLGFLDNIIFVEKYRCIISPMLVGLWIFIFSFEKGIISKVLGKINIPDLSFEIYLIHYVLIINCGFKNVLLAWFGTGKKSYLIEVFLVSIITVVLAMGWKRFIEMPYLKKK